MTRTSATTRPIRRSASCGKRTAPVRGTAGHSLPADGAICTITVPLVPPSFNKLFGREWYGLKAEKDRWYDYVRIAAAGIGRIKTPASVLATVYFFRPARRDCANLASSLDKLILDCLTPPRGRKTRGLGLLVDDNSLHIPVFAVGIEQTPFTWEYTELKFYPVGGLTI